MAAGTSGSSHPSRSLDVRPYIKLHSKSAEANCPSIRSLNFGNAVRPSDLVRASATDYSRFSIFMIRPRNIPGDSNGFRGWIHMKNDGQRGGCTSVAVNRY